MREGWRGVALAAKGGGEAGIIGILGRVQVTPRWADDPMMRHNERWWRRCWGKRGMTHMKGHRKEGRVVGEGQEKYVTISDRA